MAGSALKPSDEQILSALRHSGPTMTYVVAAVLRRSFYPLKTDFVLRRLKALEKAGRVERMPTVYAVQYGWRALPFTRCAAGRDGECSHAECPQLRDNEPRASGRHCPLDNERTEA